MRPGERETDTQRQERDGQTDGSVRSSCSSSGVIPGCSPPGHGVRPGLPLSLAVPSGPRMRQTRPDAVGHLGFPDGASAQAVGMAQPRTRGGGA